MALFQLLLNINSISSPLSIIASSLITDFQDINQINSRPMNENCPTELIDQQKYRKVNNKIQKFQLFTPLRLRSS